MIQLFNYGKTKEKYLPFLLEFITENPDYSFYFTENNKRIYIDDTKTLKRFWKNSSTMFISMDDLENYNGLILVWQSFGNNVKRSYVKILTKNAYIAEKLLIVLGWELNKELFIKIHKESFCLDILKKKGFRFEGGRGRQVLLKRYKMLPGIKRDIISKDEEED